MCKMKIMGPRTEPCGTPKLSKVHWREARLAVKVWMQNFGPLGDSQENVLENLIEENYNSQV